MATLDGGDSAPEARAWRLFVLGPVQIHLGSERVAVQGVARALLALLTRSAGQVVSLEAIVDGLWGSRPPAGADRAVASYVSRLRKALVRVGGTDAGAIVVTRPPGYLLAIDPSIVDLTMFEAGVAEGRRALAVGQPALAASRLRTALELWRGAAYADVGDAAFAPAEGRRLAELRLAAVESRVDADLAAASPVAPPALAGGLQSLVAEHPHRERLWTQLITCLFRLGQQADALAAYQQARTRLVEDLGVEPGVELRAAEMAVLAGDPALAGRPRAITVVPEGLPGPVPGCVGRDDELAWLESALDSAAMVHGEARLVVGGSGFGKTRLLAELAHRAARRGVPIRYTRGATLDALIADPDRLNLVILDDVDRAAAPDLARMSAWIRASRSRPVLSVLAATDVGGLGDLRELPTFELAPLTEQAVADVVRRLDRALADTVEPQRRLATLRDHIMTGVMDLGHVRAASRARSGSGGAGPRRVVGRDLVACPYKGLAVFEATDAELFHGRERLVAEIVARLVQAPLLTVVGASGSGKSSVVRAGLLPAIAASVLPGSADWHRIILTPAGTRDLQTRLDETPGTEPTLLFVDQFEEAFTALDGGRRVAFLDTLVDAVNAGRVMAVLALRSDFYGRCADHPGLASLVAANNVLVRPMASDELRRAVERPAALAGLLLEDGLTDRLIDDVRDAPGGLPLLSTSLLSLWERRSGRTLTQSAYREAGGVAGAVEQLGERAFASFATDELRESARRMLLRLADTGGDHAVVRRRATRAEVESVGGAVAPSVLDILAERRLVTVSGDLVEVAHEALLTEWRRLRRWLEEDAVGRQLRAHLTPAAAEWAKVGDPGELYRGARLAAAQHWLGEHAGELTTTERDFLGASEEAAAVEALRGRRSVRRLRQTLVAAVAAFLVAVAGGVVAVTQQRRADAAAAEADARRLAAQALVERDLGRAMLLGVAATRLFDSPETRANLLATMNRAPGLLRTSSLPDGDRYEAMAASLDGSTLALGSVRGLVQLYDAKTLRLQKTLAYPAPQSIHDIDINPDGRSVVVFGDVAQPGQHGIIEWDLATGKPIGEPFGPQSPVVGAVLADGDSVAVMDGDMGAVEVWSLAQRARVRVLPLAGPVVAMTVGQDRRSIVLGYKNGTTIVDGLTGSVQRYPKIAGGRAVSPDGKTMLIGEGSDVAVWDLATQSRRGVARQHTAAVLDIAWAHDGRTFVTTSDDRSVIVWDLPSLRPVEMFSGPPGRQVRAGYSHDGRSLFTAGQDGSVYMWDLTGSRRWEMQLDPVGPYVGSQLDPESATAVFDAPRNRAIVTEGETAYVVDVANGKPIGSSINLGAALHQWPELSADGARLAMGLADGRGRVWDVASRRLLLDVRVADASAEGLWSYINAGISGDGRTAAFATYWMAPVNRTEITFYDVDSGVRVGGSWKVEGSGSNRFGASADGRYLVATTSAGFAAVWDLTQGQEVARLQLPVTGSAMIARFSPDGHYLAIGNGVGRPTLWRVEDWHLLWQAEVGHNGYDVAVSFSPDGAVLASSGSDSKIFLYDVATGELLGGALGPDRNSWLYAEFRSDRNELVGYFNDGSMSRWDVDPASQVRTACEIAGRDLTEKEWLRLVPDRPYQPICS